MVVGAVVDWQEVDDVREFARSLGPEVIQPVQQLHPHQLGLYQSAPLQVVDVRVLRARAATNLPPHGRAVPPVLNAAVAGRLSGSSSIFVVTAGHGAASCSSTRRHLTAANQSTLPANKSRWGGD